MLSDLRHALRTLLRSPAFALSTVLTLALGVGANTGAFSALDTLLLQPLPYPDPGRLVSLFETTVDRQPRGVAEANLIDWQARTHAFEAMAAFQPRSFGLTLGEHDPVTVIQTGMVMAPFFDVLAVPPALGRTFTTEEEISEAHLIILTDRLWRTVFSSDPAIVGRTVALNEEPHTVIGVMPRGFEYPMDRVTPDAFIPLSRRDYCCGRLGSQDAIGRIRRGTSFGQARDELAAVARSLAADYPASNRGRSAGFRPLQESLTGNRREPLFLLLAAASLLLLISCANVAGLMLARSLSRSHEVAIRAALGAGLRQIARQFLAEAFVLSGAGAVVGFLASSLVLDAVPRFVPGAGRTEPLHLNSAAFAFALAIALGTTLLLAFAPTLLLRRLDLAAMIKAAGRQGSRGAPTAFRHVLVVTQVALSVVLLLGAGVLLHSFVRLLAVNPGFDTAHVLQFGLGLPDKRYDTELKEIEFHRELLRRLAALPGVERAGCTPRLPLRGGSAGPGGTFQIWGANIPMPQRPHSWTNVASPDYFAAMGIPLLEGRTFSFQDDRPGVHRVAIVNRTFAAAYLRGRRTLGTLLDIRWVSELNPLGVPWEIVGVVGDTRQANLDHEPIPEIYLSTTQIGMDGSAYVVRTRRDDPALPKAIAATVTQLDPRLETVRVRPLHTIVERNLGSRSATVSLVGTFGGLALLLTAVGIYGIVAFRAAERSREMAIRVALGATATNVRSLILSHGVRLTAAGVALGMAAFLLAGPIVKGQLYGVAPTDPLTLAGVASAVLLTALAASLAPSRKAGRSDPMDLLRDA